MSQAKISAYLSGLHRPGMLSFLSAMFISNVGRNAFFVAVTWITLRQTGSMREVALLLLVSAIAEFFASGPAGYLADVFDKRRLVITFDVSRACILMALGAVETVGAGTLSLYLAILLYTMMDRAYLATMQSIIPALSSRDNALSMNSLSYLLMQAGNFAGALLAGALLSLLSQATVLAAIGMIFLLSAIITVGLPYSSIATVSTTTSKGWRELVSIKQMSEYGLIVPATAYAAVLAIGVLVNTLLSGYVLHELSGGAAQFGQMESFWAVGAVIVCVVLALGLGVARVVNASVPIVGMAGIALISLWLFPGFGAGILIVAALGGLYNVCRVVVDVRIQQTVPDYLIGRSKGLIQTIAAGYGLIIYGLIAIVADIWAASLVFAVYGAFLIGVTLSLWFFLLRKRIGGGDPA